ncbi:hypothetical protein GCM10018966_064550 [Streptomyces yanii]
MPCFAESGAARREELRSPHQLDLSLPTTRRTVAWVCDHRAAVRIIKYCACYPIGSMLVVEDSAERRGAPGAGKGLPPSPAGVDATPSECQGHTCTGCVTVTVASY